MYCKQILNSNVPFRSLHTFVAFGVWNSHRVDDDVDDDADGECIGRAVWGLEDVEFISKASSRTSSISISSSEDTASSLMLGIWVLRRESLFGCKLIKIHSL